MTKGALRAARSSCFGFQGTTNGVLTEIMKGSVSRACKTFTTMLDVIKVELNLLCCNFEQVINCE